MSTAPIPPSNHPSQNPGSPTGPFPPPPPEPPRQPSWFARQSEAVRITIIGAVIAGVFSLAGAVLTSALTDRGGNDARPPVQPSGAPTGPTGAPSTPQDSGGSQDPGGSGGSEGSEGSGGDASSSGGASTPTPTSASPLPASLTYEEFYSRQTMALGLPSGGDLGSIDFDAPATRRYSSDEWESLEQKADENGVPPEADLTYRDGSFGTVSLPKGRNAAQLPPADPASGPVAEKAEDCARAAQVGGFTEVRTYEWDLPTKTVFCVVTDKGNIARAVVTGFIGGDLTLEYPPKQITLEVTLWKPRG